jgi:hypothetical protein
MTNYKLFNKTSLEQQVEQAQAIPAPKKELKYDPLSWDDGRCMPYRRIGDEDILVSEEHIAEIIAVLEKNPMLQPQESAVIEEKKAVKTKKQGDKKHVSRSTKIKK